MLLVAKSNEHTKKTELMMEANPSIAMSFMSFPLSYILYRHFEEITLEKIKNYSVVLGSSTE
jgi:hypothetical protein